MQRQRNVPFWEASLGRIHCSIRKIGFIPKSVISYIALDPKKQSIKRSRSWRDLGKRLGFSSLGHGKVTPNSDSSAVNPALRSPIARTSEDPSLFIVPELAV